MKCRRCNGYGDEPTNSNAKSSRQFIGVTQTEIANLMGITQHYLSYLEQGKRRWTAELIKKHSKAIAAKTK